MKPVNVLLVVAIIAVCFSAVNFGITVYKIADLEFLTGHATETATANLTIVSNVDVTFTNSTINWGGGAVDAGQSSATIDSEGTVTNGNWTANYSHLILQNDGNVNVTINLSTGKVAADFIGGTSPTYKLKISDNVTGSCNGNALSAYTDATTSLMNGCYNFGFGDGQDTIEIDVELVIPSDAVGVKGDYITATATVL